MLGVHEKTCGRTRPIPKALRPQATYVSMSTPPAVFSEAIGIGKQRGHQNRPRLAATHASRRPTDYLTNRWYTRRDGGRCHVVVGKDVGTAHVARLWGRSTRRNTPHLAGMWGVSLSPRDTKLRPQPLS